MNNSIDSTMLVAAGGGMAAAIAALFLWAKNLVDQQNQRSERLNDRLVALVENNTRTSEQMAGALRETAESVQSAMQEIKSEFKSLREFFIGRKPEV